MEPTPEQRARLEVIRNDLRRNARPWYNTDIEFLLSFIPVEAGGVQPLDSAPIHTSASGTQSVSAADVIHSTKGWAEIKKIMDAGLVAGPQGDLISREAAIRLANQFTAEHVKGLCVHAKPCELFLMEALAAIPAGHPAGECVWTMEPTSGCLPGCRPRASFTFEPTWNNCPYCGKKLVEHPTGEKE